jgi:hypothetical protein
LRGRRDAALEILALRQQLAVFKRKHPRPSLSPCDRLFWTTLRRLWSVWAEALIIVKPETVGRWHRAGFRRYWLWRSGTGGRPKITVEIRAMIRRLAEENPNSAGAPKIQGELRKLGLGIFDGFDGGAIHPSAGSSQDPAHQYHLSSDWRVGGAAVARDLSRGGAVSVCDLGT